MASDLQDTSLLTRIEGGDLTALEAKYYLACLTGLRNRYRSLLRKTQGSQSSCSIEESKFEARALLHMWRTLWKMAHSASSFHHCVKCTKVVCAI